LREEGEKQDQTLSELRQDAPKKQTQIATLRLLQNGLSLTG